MRKKIGNWISRNLEQLKNRIYMITWSLYVGLIEFKRNANMLIKIYLYIPGVWQFVLFIVYISNNSYYSIVFALLNGIEVSWCLASMINDLIILLVISSLVQLERKMQVIDECCVCFILLSTQICIDSSRSHNRIWSHYTCEYIFHFPWWKFDFRCWSERKRCNLNKHIIKMIVLYVARLWSLFILCIASIWNSLFICTQATKCKIVASVIIFR